MTNEELDSLSEEDRYLVIGIEDGWIDPTNEDLERYYELTGVDKHPIRTLITKTISRFKDFKKKRTAKMKKMNKDSTIISIIIMIIIICLVNIIIIIAEEYSKQKVELEEAKQELAEYKVGEVEIYPCPFCGSDNVHIVDMYGKGTDWYVKCENCYSSGPAKNPNTGSWDMSKAEAIELWNASYEKKGSRNGSN